MLTNGVLEILILNFETFLPFQNFPLDEGIKYLGYHLKANNYQPFDWLWMAKKVECQTNAMMTLFGRPIDPSKISFGSNPNLLVCLG